MTIMESVKIECIIRFFEHYGTLSSAVGYVLPVPTFGYDYHPCRALSLACGLPGGALNETALLCILRVDVNTAKLQDENTGELALHVLCKFAMNHNNRDREQFANFFAKNYIPFHIT